jgi:hypothetical protein
VSPLAKPATAEYFAVWNAWEVRICITDDAYKQALAGDDGYQRQICQLFKTACTAKYAGDRPGWVPWEKLLPGLTRITPLPDQLL